MEADGIFPPRRLKMLYRRTAAEIVLAVDFDESDRRPLVKMAR